MQSIQRITLMPRALPIAEQLRRAIKDAERRGMSRYAIAKAAGIGTTQLKLIAEGNNVPRIDTAEKIASAIGMRLVIGNGAKV
jgi:DNA-binding phage protein